MQRSQRGLVEDFARQIMTKEIAHDFKHADRVRNWALRIAQGEGYENLQVAEVAALLHDIGLARVKKRSLHGHIGALMAAEFLTENAIFPEEVIAEIANAIRHHNSIQHGNGRLLDIVRDADILDLLGAIGIMRAYTSQSTRPEYDPLRTSRARRGGHRPGSMTGGLMKAWVRGATSSIISTSR